LLEQRKYPIYYYFVVVEVVLEVEDLVDFDYY
jgi:hypothetical protein